MNFVRVGSAYPDCTSLVSGRLAHSFLPLPTEVGTPHWMEVKYDDTIDMMSLLLNPALWPNGRKHKHESNLSLEIFSQQCTQWDSGTYEHDEREPGEFECLESLEKTIWLNYLKHFLSAFIAVHPYWVGHAYFNSFKPEEIEPFQFWTTFHLPLGIHTVLCIPCVLDGVANLWTYGKYFTHFVHYFWTFFQILFSHITS